MTLADGRSARDAKSGSRIRYGLVNKHGRSGAERLPRTEYA
jgi:hypothetical protein